jgi:hypothetical protein
MFMKSQYKKIGAAFLVTTNLVPLLTRTPAQAADLSRLGSYSRLSTYCGVKTIPRNEVAIPLIGCFYLSPAHKAKGALATHRVALSVDSGGNEIFEVDGVTIMDDRGTASGTNLPFVGAGGVEGYRFCEVATDRNTGCPANITIFSHNPDKTVLFMVSECLPPKYYVCVSTQENLDYEKTHPH